MAHPETYDVVVVGGGPSGAIAAGDLARGGRKVALLDKAGRIKRCGGTHMRPTLTRVPDAMHDGRTVVTTFGGACELLH